jgi:predicted AlkP superfamily pyrophosphatase or phosphodiesterase
MPITRFWLLAAALAVPSVPQHTTTAQAASRSATVRPRLVVFLTIDQLRPDYLDRWARQLTGGLGRLSQHGAFFVYAYHDLAITESEPGHASTMSGRFPR